MATKLGVSIANYVHREIMESKPDELGVSEWVEELLVKGIAAKRTEMASDAPARNSTPLDMADDSFLIVGLPIASGEVSWVPVELEPDFLRELPEIIR